MKLFITEFADSKKEIERELKPKAEQVIKHLLKLYLMPNHSSRNHWMKEIANFLNNVSLLSGKNKFPTSIQIYNWTYGKFQDVINRPYYLKKMVSDIIDDYDEEIRKTYPQIMEEFNSICNNYFKWISSVLSMDGYVSRNEIFSKLNELF